MMQPVFFEERLARNTAGVQPARKCSTSAPASPVTREIEQGNSNAAALKGLDDQQLFEPRTGRNGKLPRIGHMYETGQRAVNQSEVEISPQVGNQVTEAPERRAIGRRDGGGTRRQQTPHRREVGTPCTADQDGTISHAAFKY